MSHHTHPDNASFNILEASIEDHRSALASGLVTSVELVVSYLLRIAKYDIVGGLNAFTVFNPNVFSEASASDTRRAAGLPPRPLEGIPYTLKDSYKYEGLTVTNGSPALEGIMSNEDSAIAKKLRDAGAVLIGKTNMPPMAAGGMQRGLYGRAESPYNSKYLTAGFSSGSSNGAATSTTSSMAVFGLPSETVSSGRSPASNNALVAYTPSRGVLSCRGLWPLYVTCDVPVPYARSLGDMFDILAVIAEPDEETKGDFWREQTHVEIPSPPKVDYRSLSKLGSLKGKRIGVPKMYVGEQDSASHAKPTVTSPSILQLWKTAESDLTALGVEIVYTDFPLVTNYEDDSVSGEANNVTGAPSDWNRVERGVLIAKAWDNFLIQNSDSKIRSLQDVDPLLIFPRPKDYKPDTWLEVKNAINYAGLPALAEEYKDIALGDIPGLKQALQSLESQRKRDLEDWMDAQNLDCIVFPANGDVGLADLEFELESARHSLQNGVKYSHGNRAIRHLGVPTVSVPMGILHEQKMPANLTFAGRAYEDAKLLEYAYAYEQRSRRRTAPPLTPALKTDAVSYLSVAGSSSAVKLDLTATADIVEVDGIRKIRVTGTIQTNGDPTVHSPKVEICLDDTQAQNPNFSGNDWDIVLDHERQRPERLSWDLKPLPPQPIMVLVVARVQGALSSAKLLWVLL